MRDKTLPFSFEFLTQKMIAFVILWLDNKNTCHESDIPVKIMKENINIVSNLNHNDFNNLLLSSNFYY